MKIKQGDMIIRSIFKSNNSIMPAYQHVVIWGWDHWDIANVWGCDSSDVSAWPLWSIFTSETKREDHNSLPYPMPCHRFPSVVGLKEPVPHIVGMFPWVFYSLFSKAIITL